MRTGPPIPCPPPIGLLCSARRRASRVASRGQAGRGPALQRYLQQPSAELGTNQAVDWGYGERELQRIAAGAFTHSIFLAIILSCLFVSPLSRLAGSARCFTVSNWAVPPHTDDTTTKTSFCLAQCLFLGLSDRLGQHISLNSPLRLSHVTIAADCTVTVRTP